MAQKLISAKTTLGTNPRAQVRSFLVHINVAKVEIELSMIVAVRGACVEGGGGWRGWMAIYNYNDTCTKY